MDDSTGQEPPIDTGTEPVAEPVTEPVESSTEPVEPVEPVTEPTPEPVEPVTEPTPKPEPVPPPDPTGEITTVPHAAEPGRGSGGRWALIAGVAALLGALVGGATVAALDDDGGTTRTVVRERRGDGAPSVIAEPADIHAILDEVQPAVVAIRTRASVFGRFGPVRGAGSGVIITPDGEVLTNAHVVAGDPEIEVTLEGERESRQADILGMDPQRDIALLKIRGASELPVARLGTSSDLAVGDDVVAIGNALALPGGPSVTKGIVSALDREIEGDGATLSNLIQTDAAINPGNSGGPLVNSEGDVVGINTAVIQSTGEALAQNIGFAIAIDTVKPLLDDLRAGRSLDQPEELAFLGVESQTLTPDIADQFDFDIQRGAIVARVTEASPADQAGLRRGDVIIRIGDDEIDSASDLVSAVRSHKPGDEVEIEWRRGEEEQRARVTLVSRAAALSQ